MKMNAKGAGERSTRSHGNAGHHDLRILNAIRQIIRAADIDSRRLAAEHQVTAPQLMCLMAVGERDSITSVDIAKRVHLSPSTIVGVVDRLEAKGLVQRERSREDRREVAITATDAGRRLVARTPFPLHHSLGRALARVPEPERRHLADVIERLVDLMGAREVDAGPMLEILGVSAHQRGTRKPRGSS